MDNASAQTDDNIESILEWSARYKFAVEMLRPISEGMAQFREFDAIPGHMPSMSSLMNFLAVCFRDFASKAEENLENVRVAELAKSRIFAARTRTDCLKRKENLLVHPWRGAEDEYLPGYLYIKGIQRIMLLHETRESMLDSELFIDYLTNHIYHDPGLALELLRTDKRIDMNMSMDSSISRISLRIQSRLLELLEKTDEQIQEFSIYSAEDKAGELIHKSQPEQVEAFFQVFKEFQNDLFHEEALQAQKAALGFTFEDLFSIRRFANLGYFETSGRVKDGKVIVNTDRFENLGNENATDIVEPIMSVGAEPGVGDTEGRAEVEILLHPKHRSLVGIVRVESQFAALQCSSDTLTKDERAELSALKLSFADCSKIMRETEMRLEELIKESYLSPLYEHIVHEGKETGAKIAKEKSLIALEVELEDVAKIEEAITSSGFYKLCNEDPREVTMLAAFSLACSLSSDISFVTELVKHTADCDIGEVFAVLDRIQRDYAMQLYTRNKEIVLCWI